MNRHPSREDTHMTNNYEYVKRCSISTVIKEMQIKTTMKYYFIYTRCCSLVTKSCLTLFMTPWTVACHGPLSMRYPRQVSRSGLPFLLRGIFPDPGIQPSSLMSPALAGRFFTTEPRGRPSCILGWL